MIEDSPEIRSPNPSAARRPVLDYMSPPPAKPFFVWPRWINSPTELAAITIGCGLAGAALNASIGPFFIFPMMGGAVAYAIARLRTRKQTALIWRVQMFLATCVCLCGTAGFVIDCDGFLTYALDHPSNGRGWLWVIGWGIAWFAVAEVGAMVQRFSHRRRRLPERVLELGS